MRAAAAEAPAAPEGAHPAAAKVAATTTKVPATTAEMPATTASVAAATASVAATTASTAGQGGRDAEHQRQQHNT